MPTYQYACTECGDRSEVVQRFSDEPLSVCSACSGKLRKIFSPVGIVFKGSGFYRTDSRNGASGVPAAKDGSANGSNGSSAETSPAGAESAKSGSASSDSGSSKSAGATDGGKKSSSVSTAAAS